VAAGRDKGILIGIPLPAHRHPPAGRITTSSTSIRAARPDGAPVYVTMDNLSAHKGP